MKRMSYNASLGKTLYFPASAYIYIYILIVGSFTSILSTVEINVEHMLLIICCSLGCLQFAMRLPDSFPRNGFLLWEICISIYWKMILVQLAFQLHLLLIDCWLQLQIDRKSVFVYPSHVAVTKMNCKSLWIYLGCK